MEKTNATTNKFNLLFVKNESQYLKILQDSFQKGRVNWLLDEDAIFETIDDIIDCYNIPDSLLDSLPNLDEEDMPTDQLLIKIIKYRMKLTNLKYPFYLIIENNKSYYIQEYQDIRDTL